MGWALYEVTKHETHAGKYAVERLRRVERTLEDAIGRNHSHRAVIREVPGLPPTPMCTCGDPFWRDGDRWLRCYSCRASQEE